MKIGNNEFKHGLMLAPMAGYSDRAMRALCAAHGAEFAVTEMVSAKALVYEQNSKNSSAQKTSELSVIDEGIPVSVQLFGSSPEFIAEAAKLVSTGERKGFCGKLPFAVDINMGCPVKKIVSNGEGAALMRNPELIYDVVSAAVKASTVPITVKLRAGWDESSINAAECALAAQSGGASAICLHARTREQFYTPGIMTDLIGEVRARIAIPLIGNGDVSSAADASRMLRETGCDGVAVGRGAIGNPWIFAQIAAELEGRELHFPTAHEILDAALCQLRAAVRFKGEARGVAETKSALAHYVKGIRGAGEARAEIMRAKTAAETEAALVRALCPQNETKE